MPPSIDTCAPMYLAPVRRGGVGPGPREGYEEREGKGGNGEL